MAADRQTSFGPLRVETQKLHRLSDGSLVAGAGDTMRIREVLDWLEAGEKREDLHKDDRGFDLLRVKPDGTVMLYDHTSHHGLVVHEKFAAVGGGRDYALAAMYLGQEAREAVMVAAHFDPGTGGKIDTLELNP